MHDFVSYLFYLLQRGMRFAVPAALICGLILAVCYAVCRKKGRRFPWGKAVCAVLLVGWAAVTVFVTLLRSEPNEFAARQWNLQLFRAWREAYQRFTLQIWLNVLLNIALFVPLGVLLPLLWKPFRKWYAALGAGFGVSLLIELAQLFTGSGMCDVDDLFTNTLGAMLGWCAAMLVLALHQKNRTWPRYCALPAAFALALSAIFISYAAQPYGNLRDASVTTADLSGVRWSVDYALDEDSKTAYVYQAQALDNVGADRFAAEFAAAHGVEFPDAYYYDDLVIYANHSSGDFLNVTLHDGTWEYSFGRDHTPVFDAPASGVTEDMLRETLDKFGFSVPADAAFTLSPYGETSYRAVFSADLLPTEGGFLHGTLTCDLRTQGDGQSTLSQLENRITTLAPVREEPIPRASINRSTASSCRSPVRRAASPTRSTMSPRSSERRSARRLTMKRILAALLSFALCLALLFFVRNKSDEPILHVALKPSGEQDAAYVYETVYASGKSRRCNAFTPDTCVFYTADYADFDTSALRSHRVNTLVATTLYDSVGNVVEPSETMIAMMHAAADQIDHAIFDFQIIVVNGQRYFAFVKLNVNWWDPCTLYEYEGGELRELAQWDNMRLLSIGFI